jgi:broad specificity phosphatase PhoE
MVPRVTEPAILTLVRHGETAANLEGVWQGSLDAPLTERGRLQAARVAERLAALCAEAAAVYTSPLRRAHDTARAIADSLGLAARVDPALSEYHLGSWEGKSYRELAQSHRLWDEIRRDPDFAPHGGESPRQVSERVSGALWRIGRTHAGERVVVVAHGGAFSLALAGLLDGDCTRWGRVMANCAVSELVLEPAPRLLRFNETGHLEGL